ncbi:MAG: DUF1667 domain-containing protein [Lachnospiraceae bacterium]|nr:DUF1667 domain-containing protein [Lachnospiraceae bacterium]
METRELTCIGCPMGCQLKVQIDHGQATEIAGNTCNRGEVYARKEVTNPTRIVTSTVTVEGGSHAVVSVKTSRDIPKDKIFEIIQEIKEVKVQAPVHIGDAIVSNVAGTGADIVATKEVK